MADPSSDRPPPVRPPTSDPETGTAPAMGTAPATGTTDDDATHVQPVEEPNTTGTLFFTLFLLMVIFGFWAVMYVELLNR